MRHAEIRLVGVQKNILMLDTETVRRKNCHMKLKPFLILAIPLTAILYLLASAMVLSRPVFSVHDGKRISFNDMIKAVQGTDFVFIGEIHDDPDSHLLELGTIKALRASGSLGAIGLEMFREDSQHILDAWVSGTLPLDQFLPVYYDNWRIAWPLYRDIFLYARKHKITLVGLNISDGISAAVAKNGFSSLDAEERKKLPPNITCTVDPTYMQFIKRAYAGHAPGMDKKFLNFCEAQMVWDKSMAWNLIRYRKEHPGKTIAILAGVGHAWKRGIPEQVSQQSSYTFKVVMPIVPDQLDPRSVSAGDADYIVLD